MATPTSGPERDYLGGGAIGLAIFLIGWSLKLVKQAFTATRKQRETPLEALLTESALRSGFVHLTEELQGLKRDYKNSHERQNERMDELERHIDNILADQRRTRGRLATLEITRSEDPTT